MIYGSSMPSPSYSYMGVSATGGQAVLSSIGPFADWYFDPTKGLHAQVAVGFAVIQAKAGTPDSNGNQVPLTDLSGNGASVMGGVGYDWWVSSQWSLGLLGRVQYVEGTLNDSNNSGKIDVQTVVASVLGTATFY
jgi:hypothetical protein